MGKQRLGIAILDGKLNLVTISGTHTIDGKVYHSGTMFDDEEILDSMDKPILLDDWQLLTVLPRHYSVLEIVHPSGIAFYQVKCNRCGENQLVRGLNNFLTNQEIECSCGHHKSVIDNLRVQL